QSAQAGQQPSPVRAGGCRRAAGCWLSGWRTAGWLLARRAGRGGRRSGRRRPARGRVAVGSGGGGSSRRWGGQDGGGGGGQDGGCVLAGGGAQGAAGRGDELAAGAVAVGGVFGQRPPDDLIDLGGQRRLQCAG